MSRLQASLILFALWAVIYLPGLGSTELKGEEGRRILPAVAMLESGEWMVPYVGGEPYLRKPPLMNWVIAWSFKVTGVRTEWSARLPSALAMLALGLTMVACSSGRGWMLPGTGLVASIMVLTAFGLLAKARFAGGEIEGVYVPLAGMAMVVWMTGWVQKRRGFFTWVLPGALLGLAMLAKGPVHLLFFYAVVIATLWKGRALGELLRPAHFAGLLVMCAIFAAWAVPYFQTEQASAAAGVWKDQMTNRVTENVFDWGSYVSNLPRGLGDLLPWVIFAPLVVRGVRTMPLVGDARLAAAYRGGVIACVATFLGMLLVPGVLPRYVLPLAVPWMVLTAIAMAAADRSATTAFARWGTVNRAVAMAVFPLAVMSPLAAGAGAALARGGEFTMEAFDWGAATMTAVGATACLAWAAFLIARREEERPGPAPLATVSGSLLGAFSILYAGAAIPAINARDNIRPVAREIDAEVGAGERMVIYDPGYLPVIFYITRDFEYVPDEDDIPRENVAVLARAKSEKKLERKRPDLRVVRRIEARGGNELLVLRPGGE